MHLLEARDVRKTYMQGAASVEVLRGIDLTLRPAEFVAIMGPSGSGKSTLLHILGGIDVPTSGRVLFDGLDLGASDDRERAIIRRRRLGFIFQSFNLLPTLSVEENVALGLLLEGISRREALRRAREMLGAFQLDHRAAHRSSELSGGEQQRVAIARAMVIEPKLILADEPTGSLDTTNGEHVIALLRRLADERAVAIVMVTHAEEMAARADRIVRLRDGRVENSSPDASCAPSKDPSSCGPLSSAN